MSGRCYALEGHDGAYNIFETESRMDKVVKSLDMVVTALVQIQHNQYMLYQAIQEANKSLNSISSSLNSFSQSYIQNSNRDSAVLNYVSQVKRKEEELIDWYNYMNRGNI